MKKKALFCWSGGKDSAFALHKVQKGKEFEIVALMTTLNKAFKRISMHGVREELLDEQANSIGLPLIKMWVEEASNQEYERKMEAVLLDVKTKGVTHVVFGDIFLEDLKEYRDNNLKKVGLTGHYPLWKKDTSKLIKDFLEEGYKTITCCVNDAHLGKNHVGRLIDQSFLEELPKSVDPCGENGEFHTFVFEGPIFSYPIAINIGETVYKPLEKSFSDGSETKGFWYADLTSKSCRV